MESFFLSLVKSLDKISVHSPFFLSFLPHFWSFCPPTPNCISHLHTFQLYYFSLYEQYNENKHIPHSAWQSVKRFVYFIFKLKYVFFSYFFIRSIFGPRKNAIYLRIFLGLFLWNLNILKILKKSLMESIIDSVKSLD